ncbi:probable inactive leucine-rich repeat receptor-like protein kinase At3g03770 [Arachis stenosperma]|uniref:probable inactive leucine-rich repeat receptor-like protein kinase At3g03770 n=1 Tax=Arachis stenosperma TaxID=217475 RepID=UPI0025AC9AF4|nr:probable inactive leucine-rich repeat receptor-like protein kinase At3g03770 [Arachis stenosperma]
MKYYLQVIVALAVKSCLFENQSIEFQGIRYWKYSSFLRNSYQTPPTGNTGGAEDIGGAGDIQYSPVLTAFYVCSNVLTFSATLNTNTDFCNIEPTPHFTLVCYEENLTQLHVVGNGFSPNALPQNFSSQTLFATLAPLSSLKVLTLVSLGLWGPIPQTISQLSSLEILNISSNHFTGVVPSQISLLKNLQSLVLDNNLLEGVIPSEIGTLQGLAVLSMKNNSLSGSHSLKVQQQALMIKEKK